MRYYAMKRRLKLAGAILIILLFLPYILSVFINGKRFQERGLQDENEIYVMEKLMQDMPESYETEALRAQAVLIRTSLYRELEASGSKTVAEDQELQKELQQNQSGIKSKDSYEKYKEAVSETQNQVLFYNESLAWTPFHRSSDGMTRVAAEVLGTDEFPYIISKECPLDKAAEDEIQVHTFEYSQIQKLCRDFLEAAEIDGANAFQKIVYIILPYLKPTFGVLAMLTVTNGLRLFDLIWVMTQGGPGGASDVMTSYIYTINMVVN